MRQSNSGLRNAISLGTILALAAVSLLAAGQALGQAQQNSPGTKQSNQSQPARRSSMDAMPVACVQIETMPDIKKNTAAIIESLQAESKLGTRLVVFHENALTSSDVKVLEKLTQEQIDEALSAIRKACRDCDLYAVVGSLYRQEGKWYNGAYVIDPQGRIIKRYTKLHEVVGDRVADGQELAIFYIDDVPTTIMICHDERYPEIFRIPVLAGAKVGIYISHESKSQGKWDNYRCQIIARAVENQISIVHCNAPERTADGGSHGHSRIIAPDGKVLAEANTEVGQVIHAIIHPRASSNAYAVRGANSPALRNFWQEGLRVLKEQNPEFFENQPADTQAAK